jgi:hypothetical protein
MDLMSLGQSMALGNGNSPTELHHPIGLRDSSTDEYGFISSHWIVKEVSFATMLMSFSIVEVSIFNIVGIVSVVDGGSLAMLSSNINNSHPRLICPASTVQTLS